MNRLRQTYWGLVISAGLSVAGSALPAGETAGVIHDDTWSIEIRSASQRDSAASSPAAGQIVPAVYQKEPPTPEEATKSDPAKKAPVIGPSLPPNAPAELDTPARIPAARMSYAEAYAAVPFSRTEYEANPTYRHQAALELMFGVLRPTTLVQHYTPRVSRFGDTYQVPYGRSDTQHINIRNFGGGYYNGQSPFGYPYGLKGNW